MSWPATVAIKRDGRTHYMGTGIYDPVPKLAMGPEKLADNYLRHGEDLGALCIGWSDSGILVDFDANLLLYFGGESDSELGFRKVLNAYLMTGPWKGWCVRYAPREMVDFALELGVDWPAMSWLDSDSTELDLGTVVNYWLKKGVCMDTEKASSAIIMRSRRKDIVHVFDSYDITNILDHGETLIEFLDCPGVGAQKLSIDGEAGSSILVDLDERRIVYWSVDEYRPACFFSKAWEGWEVVDLGEDYRAFSRHYCSVVEYDETINLSRSIAQVRSSYYEEDCRSGDVDPDQVNASVNAFLKNLGIEDLGENETISLAEFEHRVEQIGSEATEK